MLEEMLEEEHVEPKEAEDVLEQQKEGQVDPEPGRQLEDVQVDWDT